MGLSNPVARGKGFIERSHRTDNEECFQSLRFASSEERQDYYRLWKMEYNTHRQHQGIGGKTPLQLFQRDYRLHAFSRIKCNVSLRVATTFFSSAIDK